MKILAVDTSADDTSAAVVEGRRVLSHVEYSQISLHTEWGGIFPSVAKRAHQERIDWVIEKAVKNSKISVTELDALAVTYGPGLAIALEVGVNKIVELSKKYTKPIVGVNHMEGHLYSSFVQNSRGNPKREFEFPYLGLLISGGHTELILFTNHLKYEILGATLDDAAGESLDKAARMLGFGYPGGPIMERLAHDVKNIDEYKFPRPMNKPDNLNFSFSGLKTSFLYFTRKMSETDRLVKLPYLASSFQEAVFQSVSRKVELAVLKTGVNRIIVGGGVSVNERLRYLIRAIATKHKGCVYFPPYKYLNFDNAAMIGVAASFRAEKGMFVKDFDELDRKPRLSLKDSTL